jgi:very-short-patch-repair endonuclease
MKKPKSEKWLAAMAARRGKGSNQYTKAKELNLLIPKGINQYTKAKNLGLEVPSYRHSEETKQKLSSIRQKFLAENPHMVPYKLNHSSKGRSYAEQYWSIVFETKNISIIEEYGIGIYSLDFAILDKKINIEIDGEQHYLDKRIEESDNRRNKYLQELGWKIIRIRWSHYNKLTRDEKEKFIVKLMKEIGV